MLSEFIEKKIYKYFDHEPTADQSELIGALGRFAADREGCGILIINGYAGTGKTTVISAFVNMLKEFGMQHFMLAPTGRAAKVMSYMSGDEALTIHKKIYRQKSAVQDVFVLNFNKSQNAFFIIDEASMISTQSYEQNIFGSGNLLDDLIDYIAAGNGGKVIFIGDKAQLPPVGSELSPALNPGHMSMYGPVEYIEISQVVRQNEKSGILHNATVCRRLIEERTPGIPGFKLDFPDFHNINGSEFQEKLEDMYGKYGQSNCIVITRSNKQANRINTFIRNRIICQEEEIDSSDMVMVVKNNYHYTLNPDRERTDGDFIANGDIAVVRRIRKYQEMYGFRFVDATLRFPDNDDAEIECKMMLDTLSTDTPSLSSENNKKLFYAVEEDYSHIKTKAARYKKIKEDPYFNALQVKFAYAVTCHKAQGGQWDAVFVDRMLWEGEEMGTDLQRWLYTAITRAKKQLFLINFTDEFFTK